MKETIRLCGLNKAEIEERLDSLSLGDTACKISESNLDASIVIASAHGGERFEIAKSRICRAFENEVYAADDTPLHVLAAKLLKLTKNTLAVAESLTGGEICSRLTSVAGISENLFEGIVCYNRASKVNRLGVPKSVLADFGAVSRQTAYAMVEGVSRGGEVTIGLATTGLAGPEGDEGKPVGLVYIGVGGGEFILVFEKRLCGTRNEIREQTANLALFYLVRYLKGDILRL